MSKTKIWAVSIFLIAIFALFYFVSPTLPVFIVSAILAYLLLPAVKFFQNKLKLKRWLATLIVMILLLATITTIIVSIIPSLISQTNSLLSDFSTIENFGSKISNFISNIKAYLVNNNAPSFLVNKIDGILSKGFEFITLFLGELVGTSINLVSKSLNILVVFVVTIYILLDYEKFIEAFKRWMPSGSNSRIESIILNINKLVKGYIKAEVIASLAVASACGIAFWILGIKYSLILTILTFVLNFIPFFGSIFAGLIVMIVALFTSGLTQTIIIGIIVLLFQQLQGNVLSPILQSEAVNIHPITVLFSLMACSALWGVGGMFIAVPVAGIIKLLLKEGTEIIRSLD